MSENIIKVNGKIYKAYKGNCTECAFYKSYQCLSVPCYFVYRKDNKDVIFKEVSKAFLIERHAFLPLKTITACYIPVNLIDNWIATKNKELDFYSNRLWVNSLSQNR